MKYQIKRNHAGKPLSVLYACKACNAELKSDSSEAGQSFPCPTCGVESVVPGKADNDLWEAEEAARRVEQAKREASARAEKAAHEERAQQAKREREAERERSEALRRTEKQKVQANSNVPLRTFAIVLAALVLVFAVVLVWLQRELSALTATVNQNAEVANANARLLGDRLDYVTLLAENGNRHAHSHY
ncbi:MAG TPA: hypothetical protein VIL86_18000 [Tepidisphaeraceae bacterium]|jgi:cobalamin biosynthesis Mg chelatase CobN